MKYSKKSIPIDLYKRAQKRLQDENARHLLAAPQNEIQRLERELLIYRLALDIQREELLHSQRELQKVTGHYNQLFEMAPAGYFTLTQERRIIKANRAGAELLNEPQKHLVGKLIDRYIAPTDLPALHNLLQQCTLDNQAISTSNHCNLRLRIPNQAEKFVQIDIKLSSDGSEFFTLMTDLTEYKKIEHRLTTSTRLLEASQVIAKLGSVEMELPSKKLFWTAETYRIHDTTPDEFDPELDKSFQLYTPESREKISNALKKAIETGELFDLELEKYTLKGRKIDIRTTCTATYDDKGQLALLTGILQDITDRKQNDRYQQHHSHVLELLLEKAPLAVILDTIARDIERINPNIFCTILLMDSEGKHLTHGAAPSLPEFYIHAIDGSSIGPRAGSCGTAAYTGKRVIVDDISTHPWWVPYRDIAMRAGLGSCWSQPILSAEGKVLGTFAIYHSEPSTPTAADLRLIESESRLTALAIEKSRAESHLQLAASVFTHAREGILITDTKGNILEVNQMFSDITGYSREEVLGRNPRFLQSGRHEQRYFLQLWRELIEKGAWSGEIWNKRKNGEIYASNMTISAVLDGAGRTINYVNLFNDITPFKEHQRQLEYIAHYDALTALPNRVLLADRMKQAMAQSHRNKHSLAVLYIDLDGFKTINDMYGHDLGDQLLVALADRLKEVLREGDTLARIGGDEFVVVLVELEDALDYKLVLNRLLAAASEPTNIQQHILRVSASIGVTLYPQDKADADQLIRHADQAMYLAKQMGKNCYHIFDVERDFAAKHQHETLERIRTALDRQEFTLYYQPKVNMKTGTLIGCEALIRWQHPERGLIPPIEFLPVIEDHPLSLELGEWVIDTALRQISLWRQSGVPVVISVNISPIQLQDKHFVQRLSELLTRYPSVLPGDLELEIVETSALVDIDEVAKVMRACINLGVSFSVDDFGTGYSSLTYLKRLPAESLKIDQSFVRDMLDDPDDLAIVKGVIGLANAFHRKVIAEGVETIAHGELLIPLGCELAQGYGIARPMPAAELMTWVSTWKPDPRWTQLDAPQP